MNIIIEEQYTLKNINLGHFCNPALSQKRTNSVLGCFEPTGLGCLLLLLLFYVNYWLQNDYTAELKY